MAQAATVGSPDLPPAVLGKTDSPQIRAAFGRLDSLAKKADSAPSDFYSEGENCGPKKEEPAAPPAKRRRTSEPTGSGDESSASDVASYGSELPAADGQAVDAPLAPVTRTRTLTNFRGEGALAAAASGPRMLIADDSLTVRRYLQKTFEQRGYAVDVVEDGWKAFAQMQSRLYDFVFLDIEMPVMNGYRCAQAIRKWEARVEREQKQFICALTSHAEPSERELGMGIGMNLFESKPARPKRLLGIVEQALAAANGDAAAAAAIAAAATAKACGVEGSGFLGLDGDDAKATPAKLAVGDAAELCLVTSAGLGWLSVRVTALRDGGGVDVAASDGTGLGASDVPRRRVRKPGQSTPPLAVGLAVDVVRDGALRPGAISAVVAGGADVALADGTTLSAVPAQLILALHT